MRSGPICKQCQRARRANIERASIERLVEHDLALALDVTLAQIEAVRAFAHDVAAHAKVGEPVLARPLLRRGQQRRTDAGATRAVADDETGEFGEWRFLQT